MIYFFCLCHNKAGVLYVNQWGQRQNQKNLCEAENQVI